MPIPAIVPYIAAGLDAVGSFLGQKSANDTNRELAELSYQRQVEFFDKSNQYNSPIEQMKRLSAAGLNPNLVYGNGGATQNAISPPRYDPPKVQSNVPNMNNALLALQVQQAQAGIDQVKAQTEYTKMRTATEAFNSTLKELQGKQIDTTLKELTPYQSAIMKNQVANLDTENQILWNKSLMSSQDVEKNAYATQLLSRQADASKYDRDLKQADLIFKQNQNQLREMGVNESDHPLLRMLIRFLSQNQILSNYKLKK